MLLLARYPVAGWRSSALTARLVLGFSAVFSFELLSSTARLQISYPVEAESLLAQSVNFLLCPVDSHP